MGSIRFHDLPHLVGQLVVHVPRRGQAKRIGDSPVEGRRLQESREDTAVDNASTPRRKRSLAYGGDTQKRAGDNDGSGVADADSATRPKPQTPSLSVTEWGHFKLSRRGQLELSFPGQRFRP